MHARTHAEVEAAPPVDPSVARQAVKYYCMRQYNVGGRIHSTKNVTAGDEGATACAVGCNELGPDCSGFGVSGNKCFLMKAFNTNSSAADATLDALCMKSSTDWLDFGTLGGACCGGRGCRVRCTALGRALGVLRARWGCAARRGESRV
jgi:hypothetical protein